MLPFLMAGYAPTTMDVYDWIAYDVQVEYVVVGIGAVGVALILYLDYVKNRIEKGGR